MKKIEKITQKKPLEKMTRAELASQLYDKKKKCGEKLVPIGRKTALTRAEFTKRYLNGIGGTQGFKKQELISLNETYDRRLKLMSAKSRSKNEKQK